MTTLGHAQPTLDATQVAHAKARIIELRRQAYSAEYCAGQAGISRRTLYLWTEQDPEFAAAWREANESRLDWHEDVLRTCAAQGMFVPSLATLKSAGRIVDRSPPPGGTTITLYQVFQQILLAPAPALAEPQPAIIEHQGQQLAEPQSEREQLAPQTLESGAPQLEDGSTQAPAKGKPSAKPASRRRPERQPLPR